MEGRARRRRWRAVAALLSAAVLLIGAPTAFAGVTRIGINGARHSELIQGASQTTNGWLNYANTIGANWLPDTTSIPLDYPAQLGALWGVGALTGDQSVAIGQQNLHAAILAELAKGQTVAVAGGSMGTLVIDAEIAYLESLTDPLPRGSVTFYIFGGESRGFGKTYAPGVTLPVIGSTLHQVPETRYDTVVVYSQWDGWANTPDRPWNLLAVLNAAMGVFLQIDGTNDHSQVTNASPEDAVLVSKVTNDLGGTTTTYMIPTTDLPITRPLRLLGVPKSLVDKVNSWLLPMIAQGYSSMTPGAPYFLNGRLIWGKPAEVAPPSTLLADQSGPASAAAKSDIQDPVSSPASDDDVLQDLGVQEPVDELVGGSDGESLSLTEPAVADEPELTDEPEVALPADDTDSELDDTGHDVEAKEEEKSAGLLGGAGKESDSSDSSEPDADTDTSSSSSTDSADSKDHSPSSEAAAA